MIFLYRHITLQHVWVALVILSPILLALSQSLQSSGSDAIIQDLSDAMLQSIAFLTRELGRLMSTHRHADKSGLHNHPCLRPVGEH